MLNRVVAVASCALLAAPADASRIVYLAEEDHVFVPELFVVDLDRPGESLKLNKDLPWFATGVSSFAISPDGSQVAFSSDQHIAPDAEQAVDVDLYLVDITAPGHWTRIGGLPPGMVEGRARFSPDGRRLAFTASDEFFGGTQLYLVDLARPDVATRMNGDLAEGGAVSLTGFEFTPDGSHLVYVAGEIDRRYELYAVAVDAPRQSVRLNAWGGSVGDSYEGRFRILPDGRHVVYSAVWLNPGQRELHVVSLDAPGDPVTLNAPFGAGGYLQSFAVSPDGQHVAYIADAETDDVFDAWLVATAVPAVATKISGAARTGAAFLQFTPDGKYLTFVADALRGDGERDLFMVPVDGAAEPVRLNAPLAAGRHAGSYTASADGARIAYAVIDADGFAREIVAGRTDSPGSGSRITGPLDDGAVELFPPPQFSPDGDHVAFIATQSLASGIQQLYAARVDAPGTTMRLNGELAPYGIVLPVPDAFRFLPAGAPPTGELPADPPPPEPSSPSSGGGGTTGGGELLLIALCALQRIQRSASGVRAVRGHLQQIFSASPAVLHGRRRALPGRWPCRGIAVLADNRGGASHENSSKVDVGCRSGRPGCRVRNGDRGPARVARRDLAVRNDGAFRRGGLREFGAGAVGAQPVPRTRVIP